MKIAVVLLLLASLATNAALWLRLREAPAASATPLPEKAQAGAPSAYAAAQPPTFDRAVEAEPSSGLAWTSFPTGNLEALAAHLKERGFPPHIVRGIVAHYLDREYQPRRQALQEQGGIVPYWSSLTMMEPTAAEFRTLHRLQQAFDEKYSSMNVRRTDPTFQQERQAAERELIAAAKAELGEERGGEYEKSRDFAYVHAHTVAKQLELPRETGDRLWQLQRNAFAEFNRVGSAPGMNTEQRSRAHLEYVNSVKASLIAEIGEANLSTYESGGGGWLKALEQAALRGAGGATSRTVTPTVIPPGPL